MSPQPAAVPISLCVGPTRAALPLTLRLQDTVGKTWIYVFSVSSRILLQCLSCVNAGSSPGDTNCPNVVKELLTQQQCYVSGCLSCSHKDVLGCIPSIGSQSLSEGLWSVQREVLLSGLFFFCLFVWIMPAALAVSPLGSAPCLLTATVLEQELFLSSSVCVTPVWCDHFHFFIEVWFVIYCSLKYTMETASCKTVAL